MKRHTGRLSANKRFQQSSGRQKKKKNQEIAAIKTGKSKAYKIPELAAKEPVYQWSSYRLEHNRMVKAEKEKGIRFQMPTSRSRTPNCKTFIYKT